MNQTAIVDLVREWGVVSWQSALALVAALALVWVVCRAVGGIAAAVQDLR